MDVKEAIEKRRSYRSLEKVEITEDMIFELAKSASLAPSCYNNQPWRFVFVKSPEMLKKVLDTLPKGNAWAKDSSMIVAVYSKREFDCVVNDRVYYLFDTGMAVAFMILRATEMGLVAHPIAGYKPELIKKILNLPADVNLIALVVFGKHSDKLKNILTDFQREQELKRPERKGFNEFSKIV